MHPIVFLDPSRNDLSVKKQEYSLIIPRYVTKLKQTKISSPQNFWHDPGCLNTDQLEQNHITSLKHNLFPHWLNISRIGILTSEHYLYSWAFRVQFSCLHYSSSLSLLFIKFKQLIFPVDLQYVRSSLKVQGSESHYWLLSTYRFLFKLYKII